MNGLKNNVLINKLSAALLSTLLILVILYVSTASLYAYTKIGTSKMAAPGITAQSAIMYSEDLDKVIYAKNENERRDPYSITKLLTAWLVCDRLDLDKTVTISKNAANPPEGSVSIYLKEGEKITVRDLLKGMLVESGNDAATALGEAVSGSEKEFAKLMTETAESWGCENTSFANAHGMQDAKHYTTAADYLIIAQKAFEVDTIRDICAQKTITIPATNLSGERSYKNRVSLLHDETSGVVRGKTGTWDEDDCSIVLQYDKDELKIILILLKETQNDRNEDARTLLNYAHKITPGYRVANTKEPVGKLWIKGGYKTRIDVYVDNKVNAYPKNGKENSIKLKLIKGEDVKAPLKKGDVVGKCEVYADKKLVATRNLIVKEDIKKGFVTSNIYISNVVASVLLLVVLAYVILLFVVAKKRKKRRRRKRRYN